MPSGEGCKKCAARRHASAKLRLADVADGQAGRAARFQLRALGIPRAVAGRWIADGYLHPVLPGVYGVGHAASSEAADLWSTVLYAGPGAGVGGLAGALWRGVVKWRTAEAIEVSTTRRCRSLTADHPENRLGKAIVVRSRRSVQRRFYRGVPTTTIPQIVLDLAATGDVELVRFALAQLDFMRILNVRALERVCGQGIPGTVVLREAMGRPQPLFARARSQFEVRLVQVCELTGIPLPDDMDVKVAGHEVDAVWWDEMVIVECDGEGNHNTWRQRRRDSARDMELRDLGFLVIRYTTDRLDDLWAVHADLTRQLDERRGRSGAYRSAG